MPFHDVERTHIQVSQVMGDTDYGLVGTACSCTRRTDLRIAARVHQVLGDVRTVVNAGAEAGSYEPFDRHVLPVEPFSAMRAQRAARYAPELRRAEAGRYPAITTVSDTPGPGTEIQPVPIPID